MKELKSTELCHFTIQLPPRTKKITKESLQIRRQEDRW